MEFLLQGLGNAAEGGDAQFDRVWTLHVMARRSEGMKQCILEVGGSTAVLAAMAAHPQHEGLLLEGSWLLFDLRGLAGLEAMLQHQCPALQAASAWVIYDLAGKKGLGQNGPNAEATSTGLISLLLGVLHCGTVSTEALWGACSALGRLTYSQPNYGRLFINSGGGEAVLSAVQVAHTDLQRVGPEAGRGADLLASASKLLAAVADGNDQAVQRLRQLGACEALMGNNPLPPKAAEEVIWALGQLSGAAAVIEAIHRTSSSASSIHGLGVLAELLWQPGEDAATVHLQVAPAVLSLAQNCESAGVPVADFALVLKSLGGVLHGLTPHIAPGAWPVADSGVALLIKAVGLEKVAAQEAAECLGKIAAISPAWRRPLETTLGVISQRLRSPPQPGDRGRLKKYLFWAMAAIAGLPAIVHEMRAQQQVAAIQDAAICAIIDTFDDNLDCEYCLRGTHEDSGHEGGMVLEAMKTVVEAMRLHRNSLPVQYRGAHALGVLYGIIHEGNEVPSEVMEVVLSAWWRHPVNLRVGAGVCCALRAFLPPARGRGSDKIAHVLTLMRAQDISNSLRQALEGFPETYGKKSAEDEEAAALVEDAAYVLGVMEGPVAVLEVLGKGATDAIVQACGLKALCELGRAFPELFPAATAADVVARSATLASNSSRTDVQGHAELLHGLMRALGQAL
jgi:hypothetical protein